MLTGLAGKHDKRILARYFLRDARTLAGFTGACLLLFLLPLYFSTAMKNRRLHEQVDSLRMELGAWIAAAETNQVARPVVTPVAVAVATETVVTDTASDTSSLTGTTSMTPSQVLADARALKQFSQVELAQLTNSISLKPNGMRVRGADGMEHPQVDALASNLVYGFSLLERGQKTDAGVVFEAVLAACPNWPFGFYYRALAKDSRDDMARASDLFAALRSAGCMTPEGEIYHVLASLFLGNYEASKTGLLAVQQRITGTQQLMVGPLYAPQAAPNAFRRSLEEIQGLPVIHLTNSIK